jgi:predicted N-acetyltransferase YhbS
MKIRRVSNEERPTTAWRLTGYAFEPSPRPAAMDEALRRNLAYTEGTATLVAQDGDETLATASVIPMRQNVRGTVYPMAGVASVAAHPLARRQGHVRTLLTRLLAEHRDEGYVVSALYPFRPSFYARFGYVGLPPSRTVTFSPADLGELLRIDLPGEVGWQRIGDGYDDFRDFVNRLSTRRHGFAVFPDYRDVRLRDDDEQWLATARLDGEVIGAVCYRIEAHGGRLVAEDLLAATPLGRTLLLGFFARHVDQVAGISARVAPDDMPELWATDLATHTETRVAFPTSAAPMARVLSVAGLTGLASGPGRVDVTVVDDPFIAGGYLLDGGGGQLDVRAGRDLGPAATPAATLTAAGLSALVYGVLDPAELPLRGLGAVPEAAAAELRSLFPRLVPYVYADF